MSQIVFRNVKSSDEAAILDLNATYVDLLSPMNAERLKLLWKASCYFKVAENDGKVAGFLLAISSGTDYENSNVQWFAERYSQFVYIDRIVLSNDIQGSGVGSAFYKDLEFHVRESGKNRQLTAEVNVFPPNSTSLAFHRRLGFVEVGQRELASSDKVVSMLIKSLS